MTEPTPTPAREGAAGRPALPPGIRVLLCGISILLSTALWLPCMHLFFAPDMGRYFADEGIPPAAEALTVRHLAFWSDPARRQRETEAMRARNPEYDFMGRSFLAWALANMALRDPASKDRCLAACDVIIEETLRAEAERGIHTFLLPYSRDRPFVQQPERSQFVDGEIALMLGLRRLAGEKEAYKPLLAERVEAMVARMKASPTLSAESYPDECWTFCNTVALAAIKVSDVLDGTDHSAFLRAWVGTAKEKLVHRETGMLVSGYRLDGTPLHGPEGSTIWIASHCLRIIDEAFAADQYARARRELGRSFLGFGYAREWPTSWVGSMDVDSGAVVPVLGAGAASSGLAFVGARSFGDEAFARSLLTSLNFAGLPVREEGHLRYAASNQVGDAVLLYASALGPAWREVKRRERR